MRRFGAVAVAAVVLVLAGCGGGGVSTSGKDVSMASVTGQNAEQACIDLFGKASELGAKFGEDEYTWSGTASPPSLPLSCNLTRVGGEAADAPLQLAVYKASARSSSPDATAGDYGIWADDDGKAWSDDQKAAVTSALESAAKQIKP